MCVPCYVGHKVVEIPAESLGRGYEVTVEVTATIPGFSEGLASLTVITSGPPKNGSFDVSPQRGIN